MDQGAVIQYKVCTKTFLRLLLNANLCLLCTMVSFPFKYVKVLYTSLFFFINVIINSLDGKYSLSSTTHSLIYE